MSRCNPVFGVTVRILKVQIIAAFSSIVLPNALAELRGSDIHANLEALSAVLQDIGTQGGTRMFCLGDVIGYGPNPCECLDRVIDRCQITILGNHDQAALFDPDGFNPVALQAVYWTREQLETAGSSSQINRRWDFLGEFPQ